MRSQGRKCASCGSNYIQKGLFCSNQSHGIWKLWKGNGIIVCLLVKRNKISRGRLLERTPLIYHLCGTFESWSNVPWIWPIAVPQVRLRKMWEGFNRADIDYRNLCRWVRGKLRYKWRNFSDVKCLVYIPEWAVTCYQWTNMSWKVISSKQRWFQA